MKIVSVIKVSNNIKIYLCTHTDGDDSRNKITVSHETLNREKVAVDVNFIQFQSVSFLLT